MTTDPLRAPLHKIVIRASAEGSSQGVLPASTRRAFDAALDAYVSNIRRAIEALPTHSIGGYEWECYTCHYHDRWPGDSTPLLCGHPFTPGPTGTDQNEYDPDGIACDHGNLLDRDRVLAILTGLGL